MAVRALHGGAIMIVRQLKDLDIELRKMLIGLPDKLRKTNGLWDTKWKNAECESVAAYAVCCSAKNLLDGGDPLAWVTWNILRSHTTEVLQDDGSIIVESYNGRLEPENPKTVAQKDGKYQVIRVTESLIRYCDFVCNRVLKILETKE